MQDTKKHVLDILVENMGRSNILPVMNTQRKGKRTMLSNNAIAFQNKLIIFKTIRGRKPSIIIIFKYYNYSIGVRYQKTQPKTAN